MQYNHMHITINEIRKHFFLFIYLLKIKSTLMNQVTLI